MKKTLINKRWVFFVVLFFILILLGLFAFNENPSLCIAIISVGLVLIFGYAFFIPSSYTFSPDGITVKYCFALKTFLYWKDIKRIDDLYAGGKCFPWWRSYEIAYFKTKIPFHETAQIPKNKKTTEQILKYYHKTIQKYG